MWFHIQSNSILLAMKDYWYLHISCFYGGHQVSVLFASKLLIFWIFVRSLLVLLLCSFIPCWIEVKVVSLCMACRDSLNITLVFESSICVGKILQITFYSYNESVLFFLFEKRKRKKSGYNNLNRYSELFNLHLFCHQYIYSARHISHFVSFVINWSISQILCSNVIFL